MPVPEAKKRGKILSSRKTDVKGIKHPQNTITKHINFIFHYYHIF